MESLICFLESEFKIKYNLKFNYSNNILVIKNNYYVFKIRKIDTKNFELFFFWKLGLLNFFFSKQFSEMRNLYKSIKKYFEGKNIMLSEIHYQRSS